MIRIFAVSKELEPIKINNIDDLSKHSLSWYWVDFKNPTEQEIELLSSYFKFHPLAIEDCVFSLNRPKLDYYGAYNFFILNALNQSNLEPKEMSLFVGDSYVVSYHVENLEEYDEIDEAWERVMDSKDKWFKGPIYVAHQIIDKIVDQFFPAIYKVEDQLDILDNNIDKKSVRKLVDEVFEVRSDLLKLRRVIHSMKELLYRILNSQRLNGFKEHELYFADIYDHLLKLYDMVESSRDMTSDMRDSYLSMNSNRMNTNMMVLTVITTIFIPLTFIAGVYGMNFQYMPELAWKYGYFFVLIAMAVIGATMFMWFKIKGWFDI